MKTAIGMAFMVTLFLAFAATDWTLSAICLAVSGIIAFVWGE